MRAIILKKTAVAESGEIVALFSREQGKMRVSARAAKSPKSKLAFGLQPLFESEIEITSGRGMPLVTGVKIIEANSGLRQSSEGIVAGLLAAELILKATADEQANPRLYDLLSAFLGHISDCGSTYMLGESKAVWKFSMSALDALGFGADMKRCVVCGTELDSLEEANFSMRLGGVVCQKCSAQAAADAVRITPTARDFFASHGRPDGPNGPDVETADFALAEAHPAPPAEVRAIAEGFTSYILERDLKASKFVV